MPKNLCFKFNEEGTTTCRAFCLILSRIANAEAELQQVIVQTQRSNPDTVFLKSKKRWNRLFLANETL